MNKKKVTNKGSMYQCDQCFLYFQQYSDLMRHQLIEKQKEYEHYRLYIASIYQNKRHMVRHALQLKLVQILALNKITYN
jgi:hypothetical protein